MKFFESVVKAIKEAFGFVWELARKLVTRAMHELWSRGMQISREALKFVSEALAREYILKV